jgi:hypothetical protein
LEEILYAYIKAISQTNWGNNLVAGFCTVEMTMQVKKTVDAKIKNVVLSHFTD